MDKKHIEHYKNMFFCSRGLPIVLSGMRLLAEGFDPNGYQNVQQPQEEKKGSTLGTVAKYGLGLLGAGALAGGLYGLYNPNGFANIGHSVGNLAITHGLTGVGGAINNATDSASSNLTSAHNAITGEVAKFTYGPNQLALRNEYMAKHPNEIAPSHENISGKIKQEIEQNKLDLAVQRSLERNKHGSAGGVVSSPNQNESPSGGNPNMGITV